MSRQENFDVDSLPSRSRRSLRSRGRRHRDLIVVLVMPVVLALLGTTLAASANAAPELPASADVSDELRAEVAASGGAGVEAVLLLESEADLSGASGDRAAVLERLRRVAVDSQNDLDGELERRPGLGDLRVVNRFWITNAVLVQFSGSQAALDALAAVPGIERIVANYEVVGVEPERAALTTADEGPYTWGLGRIQADRVFDELGVQGDGIRVATLDTGVDISHPDLAGKMVTADPADPHYPGGWMEFNSSGQLVESVPHDSAYHGTHVSGTIHGGNTSGQAIGVAPQADLMHGLVIPGGSGSFAQVVAGMQWAVAPTDAAGNPAGQPADVVNMSLGANGFHDDMIEPTRNLRAAGIVPAFAIGNNCGSSGTASPGNVYESVAVGNVTIDGDVSSSSCGGVVRKDQFAGAPADWPDTFVKPDVSAPGTNVWSAEPGGGYRYLSGTSMATPHVAGTAALMLSAAPEMSVDQLQDVLESTAVWNDRYAPEPPDTRYGMGVIDAYAATTEVAIDNGVRGVVTHAVSGAPVTGATVAISGTDRSVVTGGDGEYQIRVEPGTYDIEITAFGFDTTTLTGVVVGDGAFTTADAALVPGPSGAISGSVTFAETGDGVPGATVSVTGVPANLSDRTDVNGAYTITEVPVGTYTVAVERDGFAKVAPAQVTVVENETARLDFTLEPPPQSVAVIGTYAQEYADWLAPYGIEADVFSWSAIEQVHDYTTIITAYGTSTDTTQAEWDAFTAATDANGAGVVFTDHAYGTGQGIAKLSQFTGHPTTTGSSTGGSTALRSYYKVTQEHPLLDGFSVGDEIPLDTSSQAKWIAWFGDYAGDGRQVLAEMGRDDATGIYGNGIAVQQRPTNRYALLSTHGVSATRGVADWTPEAGTLFLNAIEWVTPEREPGQPHFTVYDLQVDPPVVLGGEDVSVTADIKNVGAATGTYEAVLRVGGDAEPPVSVTLEPGTNQEVAWTVSRDDLGTYPIQLDTESSSFRVRPPTIALDVDQVRGGDAGVSVPLADATVELVESDGDLIPVGTTDSDGRAVFETTATSGTYTVVVRHPGAADGQAYLLTEEVTVSDDTSISLAPRVLSNAGEARSAADGDHLATRVELSVDKVANDHVAGSYLRPDRAAMHGFLYEPGRVVVSAGSYDVVHVNQVPRHERDWWLPTEIISDLDWSEPVDRSVTFGGPAVLSVTSASRTGDAVTVDWDLTDAYGNSFATATATEVRPFLDLPDTLPLEDVVSEVEGEAPNPGEVILRLQYRGADLRAGGIGWDDRPYTFSQPELASGRYTVVIEADTGTYSGGLTATGGFSAGCGGGVSWGGGGGCPPGPTVCLRPAHRGSGASACRTQQAAQIT